MFAANNYNYAAPLALGKVGCSDEVAGGMTPQHCRTKAANLFQFHRQFLTQNRRFGHRTFSFAAFGRSFTE